MTFELYQKASLGNAFGMNNLGTLYPNRVETSIDNQKAFELYRKSVNLGNSFGMNNLGHCYRYGIRTNVDLQKAFELYKRSANLGHCIAQYTLAKMYKDVKELQQIRDWNRFCQNRFNRKSNRIQ
jgi:TPR repeat protein